MTHQLDLTRRLTDSEDVQPGIRWPIAIHTRLDELVSLANQEGAAASRKEMAAALILAAEPDGEKLARHVLTYRKAAVTDALLGDYPNGVPKRGPGRPSTSAGDPRNQQGDPR